MSSWEYHKHFEVIYTCFLHCIKRKKSSFFPRTCIVQVYRLLLTMYAKKSPTSRYRELVTQDFASHLVEFWCFQFLSSFSPSVFLSFIASLIFINNFRRLTHPQSERKPPREKIFFFSSRSKSNNWDHLNSILRLTHFTNFSTVLYCIM